VGNVVGIYKAASTKTSSNAKTLMTGSHYDTERNVLVRYHGVHRVIRHAAQRLQAVASRESKEPVAHAATSPLRLCQWSQQPIALTPNLCFVHPGNPRVTGRLLNSTTLGFL
jgi:hypothetical protein